ncbi:zinc ribbon domain-containing protein [Acetivibrio cellulolyticus]|uniref:zinc ribbon domain-containing protein n=1 Tax=Acetivibrio cellulolyticus TaxID=35830 RepID=UPI0001E2DEE0|nr:zinc ribbon domain-containing protein [Acetivibrio cellulolyticus]
MAFFEEFGKKLTNAGKDVAKKTKDLADVTKLNMQINSEEDNIRNKYNEIGKLYYGLFSSSEDERFAPLCSSITESLNKINSFNEQIQAIKGIKKCSQCGTELSDSAQFCSVCGNKIVHEEDTKTAEDTETEGYTKTEGDSKTEEVAQNSEDVAAEETSAPVCPGCNETVDSNSAFCSKCGEELKK